MAKKKSSPRKQATPRNGTPPQSTPTKKGSDSPRGSGTPKKGKMAARDAPVEEIPLPPLIDRIEGVRDDLQFYIGQQQVEDGEIADGQQDRRSRSRSPLLPQTAKIRNNSPAPSHSTRGRKDGRHRKVRPMSSKF